MNFVAIKTAEQQARGMLFRTRDLLVRQRTQTINALRGHLAEFGVVAAQDPAHVDRLAPALEDPDSGLPDAVRELGSLLLEQIADFNAKIEGLGKEIHASARQDADARRLMSVPGIGPITAMAIPLVYGLSHRRRRASGAAGTSPPGWAWCRASTRPAASRGWARYRRWASAT